MNAQRAPPPLTARPAAIGALSAIAAQATFITPTIGAASASLGTFRRASA